MAVNNIPMFGMRNYRFYRISITYLYNVCKIQITLYRELFLQIPIKLFSTNKARSEYDLLYEIQNLSCIYDNVWFQYDQRD